MTTAEPDQWRALQQAAATVNLDTAGAKLIHHYSNAIYVLPAHDTVARITVGSGAAKRIARSQAITRWLVEQHEFPATEPLEGTNPVTMDNAVVSFWNYYPQREDEPLPTSQHLAALLHLLHQAGTPPVALPDWVPLESLHATVSDPVLSAVLTDDERTWILARISEVREEVARLEWPLGIGLIHGDAWAGNLLRCPGMSPVEAVLSDWDWVSRGPREIDLIPTWHAVARYGKKASWVSDFISRYEYDLGRWKGYPVLMGMRDLVQLTGPIRRARDSKPHRQALRQRLDSLRSKDATSVWTAM